MDAQALKLAQLVAVVASAGFSFGGFIGIVYSDDPPAVKALAFTMLAVLLGLHLRNCVRRADGHRPRGWQWTLAVQAVLTGAGLAWFPNTWYGNTGFLAAAVLLLIRSPAPRWAAFALVLAAQLWSGLTVRPVSEALYFVVGQAAFVGVALYGVVRLTDLIIDLRGTQASLAAAAVARERLTFAEQLNERVGSSLRQVILALQRPDLSRDELESSLATARAALSDVRSVSHAHRDGSGARPVVAGDLTTRVVNVLVVTTLLLMIVPHEVRHAFQVGLSGPPLVVFVVALLAFLALYLRACLPGGRHEGKTLAGLVLLTYAPTAVLGAELWYVATLLPGAVVVLLRGPIRWIAAGAVLAGDTVFHLTQTGLAGNVLDVLYGLVYVTERAIIVYALWWMARLTVELREARAELARVQVARERLRFARDLHDLLGYGLSVVVLKAELAFRLLERDEAAAARQLGDGLEAARQVLADLDSVASGRTEISLSAEAESARAVLEATGAEVSWSFTAERLPAEVDEALAAVLREGVTNVLRHSSARHCALEVVADDRQVRLSLTNDGVAAAVPEHEPGSGIGNLTHRLNTLGGRLSVGRADGTHTLTATAPLEPALVGGDAYRVDPVPGVELHDR
ncbi:sensor histidine kinase [Nonomuraea africana]|uniref:Two-component system sensor histidine kinase DesK n=1 Tax=Nonomuraea africana TaxID=46171 RepID=A0ABR9KM02_9ACTN|nr:histidine kinase [Nonomuraea africana]MBE1563041.1 two-component system sensor histidine kinase DesK [Nonomuraea africana]